MTDKNQSEQAPEAQSDEAQVAGADMLSEGAPSFDEQEATPEAQAEFDDSEEEFPADASDSDEDEAEEEAAPVFNENTPAGLGQKAAYEASLEEPAEPELNPSLPLDEQHPDIRAEIAARDQALQAKVDAKARKQEIKDAKEKDA